MQALLDGDDASTKRAGHIEARVWQTFQALPKNEIGRLSPRGVRYLVHNYFMKEHGWLIQGLDPHGNRADVSEIHEVNILQDKAPALVESLLEARRSNHGLSLTDVVTMITALERLIFDESLSLLRASYIFNDQSMLGTVGQSNLLVVKKSFLFLYIYIYMYVIYIYICNIYTLYLHDFRPYLGCRSTMSTVIIISFFRVVFMQKGDVHEILTSYLLLFQLPGFADDDF